MTGVFVQARMSSSRLPGKALVTLCGRPVLEWVLKALLRVTAGIHAVLTDDESAPLFQNICRAQGYELFAGSRDDVLSRFIAAAEEFSVSTVIRATADNPLVSAEGATDSLREHLSERADYTTYRRMPVGTGVEIIQADALEAAGAATTSAFDREHVTPYIYNHAGQFRCHTPDNPYSVAHDDAKVSLDTPSDYKNLVRIFHELRLSPGGSLEPVAFSELLDWFRRNVGRERPRTPESGDTVGH